jgi:trehalose-phosphatase
MDVLTNDGSVHTFFETLPRCASRLLMLDYDGTLAPFVLRRDNAAPWPGVRERLVALLQDQRTRVVIITGRSVEDALRLLDLPETPEIWGSHGWERRLPNGSYQSPTFRPRQHLALQHEREWLLRHVPAEQLEFKPASLAVHWRGMKREALAELRALVVAHRENVDDGLLLHQFDGGVELRVPGRDKGHAVATLLHEIAPCAAAYLGDDRTDEDAFRVLRGNGLCVQVRGEAKPTLAQLRLNPPAELLRFLDQWLEN